MKGICKLCGLERDLIKKSHIIPEFMYQYLFDADHKIIVTDTYGLLDKNSKPGYKLTGEYEGEILCNKCDNEIIGQYESYSSKTIFGTNIPIEIAPKVTPYHNAKGQNWSQCENIDYNKYKLFLLSILWRAHISTRPLFKEINLGPHGEIIRQMILNGDAGEEEDYPIVHWTTVHNGAIPTDYVLQPRMIRFKAHRIHIFPISGMFILFYVSNHEKPRGVMDYTIRKNGTMIIEHIPIGQGWSFIAKYLNVGKK